MSLRPVHDLLGCCVGLWSHKSMRSGKGPEPSKSKSVSTCHKITKDYIFKFVFTPVAYQFITLWSSLGSFRRLLRLALQRHIDQHGSGRHHVPDDMFHVPLWFHKQGGQFASVAGMCSAHLFHNFVRYFVAEPCLTHSPVRHFDLQDCTTRRIGGAYRSFSKVSSTLFHHLAAYFRLAFALVSQR